LHIVIAALTIRYGAALSDSFFYRFIANFGGERILKLGQHLAKLGIRERV